MSTPVSTTDVEQYFTTLSNWGRWGEHDRRGALNLITDAVRKAAAGSVRSGTAVSLARDLDPSSPDPLHSGLSDVHRSTDVREVVKATGETFRWDAFADHVALAPHGGNAHLDGFAHYSWDGSYYNGVNAAETTVDGGAPLSVSDAVDGIVTRGVLLDIAGLLGVESVERGYAITVDDILAAEKRQGVTVRAGDALLIHSGNAAAILKDGPLRREDSTASSYAREMGLDASQTGLDAAVLPWIRERDVAVMGADGTHDVQPPQFDDFDFARPIHSVCLVAMGVWLMDNLDLTQLAAVCAEREQWDFLFTALPWRFVGTTSSPLNPVAVL
ncbi:cyclase family protein [Leifsonia naganoensis]|uniref:Kynurenine formamidase n=1 Tax=Leifsonia naganoensis TaxID=150025 RepID=A0A853DN61_9MICO|nr:cyclase family protein [Leifsonia naganoensis]NYK10516.1 kynurenine formamidase [Leifsonia naganoensis]